MAAPKTILLVDDDKSFIESNKDLLEAYGYVVHYAYNGESGFKIAKDVHPELIILDVMMTYDTEGFDFARKIREEPCLSNNVKILLVSGITSVMKLKIKLAADNSWLPVDRIMEKPIDPAQLIEEVGNILSK